MTDTETTTTTGHDNADAFGPALDQLGDAARADIAEENLAATRYQLEQITAERDRLQATLKQRMRGHVCTPACAPNAHIAFEGRQLVNELTAERDELRTRVETLHQIATEAAQIIEDVAAGRADDRLGNPNHPYPRWQRARHLAAEAGIAASTAGASVPSPARAGSADGVADIVDAGEVIRRYLDREAPDVSRALFNMDLEGAVTALRDAGWLASPRAQVAPVGPSQGREIPEGQLIALIAGMPVPDSAWTLVQADLIDRVIRAAYRTGYAAALGCPISVSPDGDRLVVGDRPEQADPGQGAPCGRCWACLGQQDTPLARVVEAAVSAIAEMDRTGETNLSRLTTAVRQLLDAPACVDLSVPAVSIAETAAEEQPATLTVSGCYRCQLGDPHEVHETAAEVYGLTEQPGSGS